MSLQQHTCPSILDWVYFLKSYIVLLLIKMWCSPVTPNWFKSLLAHYQDMATTGMKVCHIPCSRQIDSITTKSPGARDCPMHRWGAVCVVPRKGSCYTGLNHSSGYAHLAALVAGSVWKWHNRWSGQYPEQCSQFWCRNGVWNPCVSGCRWWPLG